MQNEIDTKSIFDSSAEDLDLIRALYNGLARKLREKLATGTMLLLASSRPTGFRKSTLHDRTTMRAPSPFNLKLPLMMDNIDASFATKQFIEVGDTSFDRSDHEVYIEIFIYRW